MTRYGEKMLIGEKLNTGRKSCPVDTLLVEWWWSAQRKTISMTTLFLQWYWQTNTEVLSENQTLHQWRFICGMMLTSENRGACRKSRPSAALLMEGYWQGKTKILSGKTFPLILCVPHHLRGLDCDGRRLCSCRFRRMTALTKARAFVLQYT